MPCDRIKNRLCSATVSKLTVSYFIYWNIGRERERYLIPLQTKFNRIFHLIFMHAIRICLFLSHRSDLFGAEMTTKKRQARKRLTNELCTQTTNIRPYAIQMKNHILCSGREYIWCMLSQYWDLILTTTTTMADIIFYRISIQHNENEKIRNSENWNRKWWTLYVCVCVYVHIFFFNYYYYFSFSQMVEREKSSWTFFSSPNKINLDHFFSIQFQYLRRQKLNKWNTPC